jgi:hypothetical protein
MHLVAIAWIYVVLMMALVEALSSQGTLLGALFTVLLYGVLPLTIVLYLLGTPMRWRARRQADRVALAARRASAAAPDQGHHAAGDPVAAERKEV